MAEDLDDDREDKEGNESCRVIILGRYSKYNTELRSLNFFGHHVDDLLGRIRHLEAPN